MSLTIYADLGSPLTSLAYQRARRLTALGVECIEWRPVVEGPGLAVNGRHLDPADAASLRATIDRLALDGEERPLVPATLTHPRALISAYAEALADGVADELFAAAMTAQWRDKANLSDPAAVRRLVAAVMGQTPARARRHVVGEPAMGLGDRAPRIAMRRSGGTITPSGGPTSGAAARRMKAWRAGWQARGCAALPLVLTSLGEALPGERGLAHLAAPLLLPAPVPSPARARLQTPNHALVGAA